MRSKKICAAAIAAILSVGSVPASVLANNLVVMAEEETTIANNGKATVSGTSGTVKVAADCEKFTLDITGVSGTAAGGEHPAAENEVKVTKDGFTFDAENSRISGEVTVTATSEISQTVTVTYETYNKDAENDEDKVVTNTVTVTVTKAAAAQEPVTPATVTVTVGDVTVKNTVENEVAKNGSTVTITLKEAVTGDFHVDVPVTVTGGTLVNTEPDADGEVAVYGGAAILTPNGSTTTYTVGITLTDNAGSATLTYKVHNGTELGAAQTLVTIRVVADIDEGGETGEGEGDETEEGGEGGNEGGNEGNDTPVTPPTSTPTTSTPSTSTPSTSTPAASDSSTTEAPAVEFKPAEVVVDEAFSEEEAKVVEEIKIEAPEGTFAEGTKLSVKPDTKVTAENAFALDISFELDGAAVQPKDGAAVTVSVPVPPMFKDVDESTLKVFYFDGTNYTKLDATVTNGVVTFKTTHFSTYVISTENLAEKNTPAATDPNPITGVAAMAALPVVALAGAVVIVAKKRK